MNPHRNDDDDNLDRKQVDDSHDHAEADNLFTLGEVAGLLRVPPATLRYWRHQHTGPRSFRIGRHVRYSRTDVEEWLRNQRDADGSGAA
jgi:excisionase family DNA binding protein